MEEKNNCLICGEDLQYDTSTESKTCYYCGHKFKSQAQCVNGHFVCDYCHAGTANQIIRSFCLKSNSADPVFLANEIMKHPSVAMHGPEHHFLVPAVLLTAFHNKQGTTEKLPEHIGEAAERSKNVLGGFCGFYGTCGAAIGTGIFMSVITQATPTSVKGWQLSNTVTAQALTCVAKSGGPRCCKRDTYIALEEAIDFIEDKLGIQLDRGGKIVCSFNAFNKQCKQHNCQYFGVEAK